MLDKEKDTSISKIPNSKFMLRLGIWLGNKESMKILPRSSELFMCITYLLTSPKQQHHKFNILPPPN